MLGCALGGMYHLPHHGTIETPSGFAVTLGHLTKLVSAVTLL